MFPGSSHTFSISVFGCLGFGSESIWVEIDKESTSCVLKMCAFSPKKTNKTCSPNVSGFFRCNIALSDLNPMVILVDWHLKESCIRWIFTFPLEHISQVISPLAQSHFWPSNLQTGAPGPLSRDKVSCCQLQSSPRTPPHWFAMNVSTVIWPSTCRGHYTRHQPKQCTNVRGKPSNLL